MFQEWVQQQEKVALLSAVIIRKNRMNNTARLVLSSASLLGIILVSNAINDVEASLLSSAVIVLLYQGALAVIGGVLFLLARYFDLLPEEEAATQEITVKQLEREKDFEIKDISFDHAKVIGTFGGKDIFDTAKVVFENGYEKTYTFADTIKYDSPEKLNVSALAPGSLIIEPGIVYVPGK